MCLLISAVVSDIWVKRLLKHRWLQNLYVAMEPSWHSLGGLEVFRCQRCNLLKWFTCHFWDICFLWKDREVEGWAVSEWEAIFFCWSTLEEFQLNMCFIICCLRILHITYLILLGHSSGGRSFKIPWKYSNCQICNFPLAPLSISQVIIALVLRSQRSYSR